MGAWNDTPTTRIGWLQGVYQGVQNNGFTPNPDGTVTADISFHNPAQAQEFGWGGGNNQKVDTTGLDTATANRLSYLEGIRQSPNSGFTTGTDGTVSTKLTLSPDKAFEFGYTPAKYQQDLATQQGQAQLKPGLDATQNAITNTQNQDQLAAGTATNQINSGKADLTLQNQQGQQALQQQGAQSQIDTSTGLAQIGLQKQGIDTTAANAITGLQGQDTALAGSTGAINSNFDTLGSNLQLAAKNAQSAFEERQNQLGLLQSGNTAAGNGKIASDLSNNTAQNESSRAQALAQVALQRAGIQTNIANVQTSAATQKLSLDAQAAALTAKQTLTSQGIDSQSANLAARFAIDNANLTQQQQAVNAGLALQVLGLNQQSLTATAKYNSDLTSFVNNYITGANKAAQDLKQQKFDDGMKVAALMASIPAGQSIDVPGVGTVTGIKPLSGTLKTQVVDTGGSLKLINSDTGQVISNLGVATKPAASGTASDGTPTSGDAQTYADALANGTVSITNVPAAIRDDVLALVNKSGNSGDKVKSNFYGDIAKYATDFNSGAMSREGILQILVGKYPQINKNDISKAVYTSYPDKQ